jgi:capsid protein
MRPAGMRPAGMRPAGMRPAGMRPAGMRPAGMRPAGMRPAGMRPYDESTGYLDPEEWSEDVAALFCEYSAVLRLGGRLACEVTELPISAWPLPNAQYVPESLAIDPDEVVDEAMAAERIDENDATAEMVADEAQTTLFYRRLQPRSHELTIRIVMRNRLVRSLLQHPELAWSLKQDVAYALARRADAGFLHGNPDDDGPAEVRGIRHTGRAIPEPDADADVLKAARAMVTRLRSSRGIRFENPGWVLHPSTLDALTNALTVDAQTTSDKAAATSLDAIGSGALIAQDGTDGGALLGYPFVVTEAAADDPAADDRESRMYFSSDWSAAWVSAVDPLVEVDFSGDIRFDQDETVVRAIMHHDFALSRPDFFIYTDPPITDTPPRP